MRGESAGGKSGRVLTGGVFPVVPRSLVLVKLLTALRASCLLKFCNFLVGRGVFVCILTVWGSVAPTMRFLAFLVSDWLEAVVVYLGETTGDSQNPESRLDADQLQQLHSVNLPLKKKV